MADIRSKKPKVLGARVAGLRLTQEERFVMARIDGQKSVDELVDVTGLAPERLEQIVTKLAFDGAVDLGETRPAVVLPPDEGETSMADFAAALGMDPSSFQDKKPELDPKPPAAGEVAPISERKRPKIMRRQRNEDGALVGDVPAAPPPPPESDPYNSDAALALEAASLELFGEAPDREEVILPSLIPEIDESSAYVVPPVARPSQPDLEPLELEEVHDELEEVHDELEEVHDDDNEDEEGPPVEGHERRDSKADELSRAVAERNYREVFEKRWHPLPVDARIGGAKTAKGADLLALCFDPDPRVISGILENASVGLDHVRLIAFYHRTNTGLEILARRQDWLRDILVERRLIRNPMIGDIVLTRVMNPKRLFPTYKIAIDRDVPELSRAKVRGMIKKKWATAPAEERADLLFRTEARCLNIMTGCTFDAKTTAILCGRPINSVMFVQSISKFPSSPPALLAHLFKQPFVRKNPPLKKMLLAHPNMPGDVKRTV